MLFRVDATAEVAKACFKNFKSQELKNYISQHFANTVWAFAAFGYESPSFFDAIVEVATACLKHFLSQGLGNT
eukprot:5826254-Karenia_brevis.AAC.1